MTDIIILTGAGISADSGVATFRDEGGIWSQYDIEDVATPQAFERDPKLVNEFYNARRAQILEVAPNPAHYALARLQKELPGEALIITQNVDDLHERAGSPPEKLIHMHGELLRSRCAHCGDERPNPEPLSPDQACAACGRTGGMRPAVVWFHEMPLMLDEIYFAMTQAKAFVSIGTSGHVYPAAGFVAAAKEAGMTTMELNLEATSPHFDEARLGRAAEIVPSWVDEMLGV